jgi:hypothetical protein
LVTQNVSRSWEHCKIIISGNVLEVYRYEKKPASGGAGRDDGRSETLKELREFLGISDGKEWIDDVELDKSMSQGDKDNRKFFERVEEKQREEKNLMRSKLQLRRLINANFDEGSKFYTFTFADNITDLDVANKEWKKFVQRMRRRFDGFKYVAVIEFQKRGAVHYHMIADLPYIKTKEIADIWGNGFVKANRIKHVDNVGAYVIKYMSKDLHDERLVGRKAYQCSKGLEKPQEIAGEEAFVVAEAIQEQGANLVLVNEYRSDYCDLISYEQYNFKRNEQ